MSSLVACIVAACAIATRVLAADAPALLTGYTLTSWTQKDGIPSALIWSVAQDPAGYLWLGTDSGALRFDGVRFVPWDALASIANPSASVRSVCVSRDGTVWFGLGEPGGIVALRDGVARSYSAAQGLPDGVVMAMVEVADGTLWAGGRFGLLRLVADRWQRADEGLPPGLVIDLFTDGHALVVGAAAGVFRREDGDKSFAPLGGDHENARSIARDTTGRLWVTDPIVGPPHRKRRRRESVGRAQGSRLAADARLARQPLGRHRRTGTLAGTAARDRRGRPDAADLHRHRSVR